MTYTPIPQLDRRIVPVLREMFGGENRHELLGRLENADHRSQTCLREFGDPPESTRYPGYRVRHAPAIPGYSGPSLVLKHTHHFRAEWLIQLIEERTRNRRALVTEKGLAAVVETIPAEAVAADILVMPFVDVPSIYETMNESAERAERTKSALSGAHMMQSLERISYLLAPELNSSYSPCNTAYLGFQGVNHHFALYLDHI